MGWIAEYPAVGPDPWGKWTGNGGKPYGNLEIWDKVRERIIVLHEDNSFPVELVSFKADGGYPYPRFVFAVNNPRSSPNPGIQVYEYFVLPYGNGTKRPECRPAYPGAPKNKDAPKKGSVWTPPVVTPKKTPAPLPLPPLPAGPDPTDWPDDKALDIPSAIRRPVRVDDLTGRKKKKQKENNSGPQTGPGGGPSHDGKGPGGGGSETERGPRLDWRPDPGGGSGSDSGGDPDDPLGDLLNGGGGGGGGGSFYRPGGPELITNSSGDIVAVFKTRHGTDQWDTSGGAAARLRDASVSDSAATAAESAADALAKAANGRTPLPAGIDLGGTGARSFGDFLDWSSFIGSTHGPIRALTSDAGLAAGPILVDWIAFWTALDPGYIDPVPDAYASRDDRVGEYTGEDDYSDGGSTSTGSSAGGASDGPGWGNNEYEPGGTAAAAEWADAGGFTPPVDPCAQGGTAVRLDVASAFEHAAGDWMVSSMDVGGSTRNS